MKKRLLLFPLLALLTFSFTGCKKDAATTDEDHNSTTGGTGSLRVSFVNMFGDSLLELSTESYVTANNEDFMCTSFRYYISNIRFTDANGNTWSETESYHLIDAASVSSLSFLITGVPQRHYVSMTYMIGVDSARNVSGAQTGALDPGNNMFWTWNTGYIMAKLEGESPQSTAASNNVTYHIGGYSGSYAGQRTVTVPFGSIHAQVTETGVPEVTLKADVGEWFTTPNTLSIATTPFAMGPSATTAQIADNYSDMFSLVSVQN